MWDTYPYHAYFTKKEEADKDRREHLEAIDLLTKLINNDTLISNLLLRGDLESKKKELKGWLNYYNDYKKRVDKTG